MRYFANPCAEAEPAMRAGKLGLIDTPLQGTTTRTAALRAAGVTWCADNGAFSARWEAGQWWAWLERLGPHAGTCAFAVAPDVVGDAIGTYNHAAPWLPRIRALGYPTAYVAQNGAGRYRIPWLDLDVLFLGGALECPTHHAVLKPRKEGGTGSAARYYCPSCGARLTEWKLGPEARHLTTEALERGKAVHMGRVNSRKRYRYARAIGCSSADGTFLTRGATRRLPELLDWISEAEQAPLPLR